jgi:hypothetical protein
MVSCFSGQVFLGVFSVRPLNLVYHSKEASRVVAHTPKLRIAKITSSKCLETEQPTVELGEVGAIVCGESEMSIDLVVIYAW